MSQLVLEMKNGPNAQVNLAQNINTRSSYDSQVQRRNDISHSYPSAQG